MSHLAEVAPSILHLAKTKKEIGDTTKLLIVRPMSAANAVSALCPIYSVGFRPGAKVVEIRIPVLIILYRTSFKLLLGRIQRRPRIYIN